MADTETIDPRYRGLDTWRDEDILEAFWEGQTRAIAAVHPALPAIAAAARDIAGRIEPDGRLIYAGAGSAGRQAALDGMELGATFGWPDERVVLLMAEGNTLVPGSARGGYEDDAEDARVRIGELKLNAADALIVLAASGTTPFALAAAEAAREAGALVVAIANNAGTPLLDCADHAILLQTGAEVIAGSTRMNAGTAHKAALGMLSSLLMTRLGHVHDGLMVSMRADCAKLEGRAPRIVKHIAGCSQAAAERALETAGGRIKPAILVALGAGPAEADRLLEAAQGNLRVALNSLPAHTAGE
jgi:N-acetylmuramic acid 6-phosphate etherase